MGKALHNMHTLQNVFHHRTDRSNTLPIYLHTSAGRRTCWSHEPIRFRTLIISVYATSILLLPQNIDNYLNALYS